MPHTARTLSSSGYYHVVPKGMGDQVIFEDREDFFLYVDLMRKAKSKTGILIHAYCLMSNHAHLILGDADNRLSEFMKITDQGYATRFAEKTGRRGGIFRRSFWSEPISTDEHLLCAVRYAHANPAAAGICPASKYEWSSAQDYLGREGIADTQLVLEMLGGRDGFIRWSKESNATAVPFQGSRFRNHLTDAEAIAIARMILNDDPSNLSALVVEQRSAALKQLKDRGLSIRQIARITGLGKTEVERS